MYYDIWEVDQFYSTWSKNSKLFERHLKPKMPSAWWRCVKFVITTLGMYERCMRDCMRESLKMGAHGEKYNWYAYTCTYQIYMDMFFNDIHTNKNAPNLMLDTDQLVLNQNGNEVENVSSAIDVSLSDVTVNSNLRFLKWRKHLLNTLRPRRNGQHSADDIFKRIFFNENVLISLNISLKFVPKGPINNIPALVQIMAWRRPGDKPLSEPVMVGLPTHICVTRPQWVNEHIPDSIHLKIQKWWDT